MDKPSELSELATMIKTLADSGKTADDAIAECERQLKVLRTVKKMLDADKEPAPRVKKDKTPAKDKAA